MDIAIFLKVTAAVHCIFGLVVLRALVRDHTLYLSQKIAQSLIVVLVPILGPIGILVLLASLHEKSELRELLPFPLYHLAQDHAKLDAARQSADGLADGWIGDSGGGDAGGD
ncbi:MAG: hypothetical protein AAF578_04700 [Pseudomonadota bacterium]